MPCYDERNSPSYINEHGIRPLQRQVGQLEAALCAICTVLDHDLAPTINDLSDVLDYVDWKEAGVSRRWVEAWWREHQEEDRWRKRKGPRET